MILLSVMNVRKGEHYDRICGKAWYNNDTKCC